MLLLRNKKNFRPIKDESRSSAVPPLLKTDVSPAADSQRSQTLPLLNGLPRDSSASCFLPITGLPFSFATHRLR